MYLDALALLRNRLVRLRADHEARLVAASGNALARFDPQSKPTFRRSLDCYAKAMSAELDSFCNNCRNEILTVVKQLFRPLSQSSIQEVMGLAVEILDSKIYPQRLLGYEMSMFRHAAHYGISASEWGIKTEIDHAKHRVNTANQISRIISSLSDDLNHLRLKSICEVSALLSPIGSTKMPFSELMNDNVELLKKDGTARKGLKASVQRDKIYMDAGNLLIEVGDLILRKMSNGAEETYCVIHPGFYEAFGSIAANYQMDVNKLGAPEASSAIQSITYNINGHNTRINQHSIDNSTNTVEIDSRAIQHISELRHELDKAPLSPQDKQDAMELVDQLEGEFTSGKPKKSVVSALLGALPQVANVAGIVSAISGLF